MKDGESVDDFALRLNTIVTGIRSLSEKVKEIKMVKKFLWAVLERFMLILSSIKQFGDLKNMTVAEVMGRLKTHEERLRGFGDREGEPSLLLIHVEWSSWSKRTDEKDFLNAPRGRRGLCGRGRECPNKRHGDEANLTQTEDEEVALMMAITSEEEPNKVFLEEKISVNLLMSGELRVESNVWFLDNGASNHMMGDCLKFHELDEMISDQVRFRDGLTVTIMGKGSILFDCKKSDQQLLNESVVVGLYALPKFEALDAFKWLPFKKLDDRSKKMVYFGVKDETKGNRLFDPQDGNYGLLVMCLRKKKDETGPKKRRNQKHPVTEATKSGQPHLEAVHEDSVSNSIALEPISSSPSFANSSSTEIGPQGLHSLADVYKYAKNMTLDPEELMMIDVDQPSTFKETVNFRE
ncbi:uncharacterized protein LOC112525040 [Cynara cardunculus var. scolymus]|uniref:uncharacterized protein LOC112525040 n=1 Tax=Cynara cardunculus var. scolymus TaxID=59895 RepID=UPI000D628EB6|nr:uncharacterized protein LOC112525040 [Cynara cardunculus var. scolymus]